MRKSFRHLLTTLVDFEVRAVGYADIAFVFDVDVMSGGWVIEPLEVATTATTVGQLVFPIPRILVLGVLTYPCYQHNTWRTSPEQL